MDLTGYMVRSQATITIPASRAFWTDTNLVARPGDRIVITVSGEVSTLGTLGDALAQYAYPEGAYREESGVPSYFPQHFGPEDSGGVYDLTDPFYVKAVGQGQALPRAYSVVLGLFPDGMVPAADGTETGTTTGRLLEWDEASVGSGGKLWLIFNDTIGDFPDNGGEFTAEVTVYQPFCICCNAFGRLYALGFLDYFFHLDVGGAENTDSATHRAAGRTAIVNALTELRRLPGVRAAVWQIGGYGFAGDDIVPLNFTSDLDSLIDHVQGSTFGGAGVDYNGQHLAQINTFLGSPPVASSSAGRKAVVATLYTGVSSGFLGMFDPPNYPAGYQFVRDAADQFKIDRPDTLLFNSFWRFPTTTLVTWDVNRESIYVGQVAGDGYLEFPEGPDSRLAYEDSLLTLAREYLTDERLPFLRAVPNLGVGAAQVTTIPPASVTPEPLVNTSAPAPHIVRLEAGDEAARIAFSWVPFPGADGFDVLVNDASVLTLPPVSTASGHSWITTTGDLTGLVNGVTVNVSVRAKLAGGQVSPSSSALPVTPLAAPPVVLPDAPTDPVLLRESADLATLYWTHPAPLTLTEFRVFRTRFEGTINEATTQIATVSGVIGAPPVMSASLVNLDIAIGDVLRVRAVSVAGVSAPSLPAAWNPVLPPGTSIRVTSADGRVRRRFPLKNLLSIRARESRQGGYLDCSVTLATAPGDTALSLSPKDRIEWFFQGTRIYRGFFYDRETSPDAADRVTLVFHGAHREIGRPTLSAQYRILGGDLSEYVARAGAQILQSVALPDVRISPQTVGILSDYEGADQLHAGEFLSNLAEKGGNQLAWGARVSTSDGSASGIDTGRNELFFEPMKAIGAEADHVLPLTARSVRLTSLARNQSDIVNDLTIVGGAWKYPNLLPDGSFETSSYADETSGNLLKNPSFDATGAAFARVLPDWTRIGGADVKRRGETYGEIPRTGDWSLELDGVGEAVEQVKDAVAGLVTGDVFTAGVFARLEKGTAFGSPVNTFSIAFNWRVGGVDQVLQGVTVSIGEANYQRFELDLGPVPAGANGYRLRFTAVSVVAGSSTLLDDAFLINSSRTTNPNWKWTKSGGAQILLERWDVQDTPAPDPGTSPFGLVRYGAQSGLISVTASDGDGQDVVLERRDGERVPVVGGQTLRLSMWVRAVNNSGGTIPKLQFQVRFHKEDGGGDGDIRINFLASVRPDGGWVKYSGTFTVQANTRSVKVKIAVRGSGGFYFDGLQLRDASTDPDEFAGGANFVTRFRAETLFSAAYGVPADPDYPVARSRDWFGARPEIERFDNVVNVADAESVARAYFRQRAREDVRPTISLFHDARVLRIGQAVRGVGRHAQGYDLVVSRPIVEIESFLDRGGVLRRDLTLFSERPDTAKIIGALALKESRRRGGAGSPGFQVNTQNGSGGSSGGGGSTQYLSTIEVSDSDATLHDAYAPMNGPHVLPAERAAWNATTAEVLAARDSAASATSYPSLDARLEAIESSSGGGQTWRIVTNGNPDDPAIVFHAGVVVIVEG